MPYEIAEIRQYIRDVVREAKNTARVDTGFLKRSIRGDYVARTGIVEFRQIFYGAFKGNSQLVNIAQRIMPNDLPWRVILEDEEGNERIITGITKTGRKLNISKTLSLAGSTFKIKDLINRIRGKKKDDTTDSDRTTD